jgi:hypothetical protein
MSLSISCVDTLNYEKSMYAIKRTIHTLREKTSVDHIYWYSDIKLPETFEGVPVTNVVIKKLTGQATYSYVTLKMCPMICEQDFDLIVQWDGYAVNPEAWTDKFFDYDYIGATWDDGVVGNGGFSLRSNNLYEKLLELNINYRVEQFDETFIEPFVNPARDRDGSKFAGEDVVICRIYKEQLEKLGIKFAPHSIADQFSIENHSVVAPWTGQLNPWVGKSLGFHGKHGILQLYNV